METKSKNIIKTIDRIVELLKMCNYPSAEYFCDFLVYTLNQLNKPHELHKVAENILKIYGGMGTFGDLAIFSNGTYLKEEHREFDKLREKLYLECKSAIEEARGAE